MKKTKILATFLMATLLLTGCNDNNATTTAETKSISVTENTYATERTTSTTETKEETTTTATSEPIVNPSSDFEYDFDVAYITNIENNVSDDVDMKIAFELWNTEKKVRSSDWDNKGRDETTITDRIEITFNKNTAYEDIATIEGYELVSGEDTLKTSIDCKKTGVLYEYSGVSQIYKNELTYTNWDGKEKEYEPVIYMELYNENGVIEYNDINDTTKVKAITGQVNNIYDDTSGQTTPIMPVFTIGTADKKYEILIGANFNIVADNLVKCGVCEKKKDIIYKINNHTNYMIIKNTEHTCVIEENANGYINNITLINN